MKSVCKTCTKRHWYELDFCPHKFFAYEIDAEKTYEKHPLSPLYASENDLILYNKCKAIDPSTRPQFHNRQCSLFLGDTVAETVLSKVFKNVVRTPIGHVGFDFWCNNGFKIDVKSACAAANSSVILKWAFAIKRNKIPDYFLCIAFDNRQDLNPLHLWLIPSKVINHMTGVRIESDTLYKWKKYKLKLDKTVACCDTL